MKTRNSTFFKTLILCLATTLLYQSLASAAITYPTATKTARMTAVRDTIDLGAGAGKLEICTASCATVLVTITLNDPSGTVSGTTLTLSGFPKSATASATGTAALARIRDSNNTDVITGLTVGTSGTDLVLDNTSINSGQSVTITGFSFSHAP